MMGAKKKYRKKFSKNCKYILNKFGAELIEKHNELVSFIKKKLLASVSVLSLAVVNQLFLHNP